MCCSLYQHVFRILGYYGSAGTAKASSAWTCWELIDGRRQASASGSNAGIFVAKKFTLSMITDDVSKPDGANLAIKHLLFEAVAEGLCCSSAARKLGPLEHRSARHHYQSCNLPA
jgi:hypothetical protein